MKWFSTFKVFLLLSSVAGLWIGLAGFIDGFTNWLTVGEWLFTHSYKNLMMVASFIVAIAMAVYIFMDERQ